MPMHVRILLFFFFQAEDGIRDVAVTGVQTCALPISSGKASRSRASFSIVTPSPVSSRGRETGNGRRTGVAWLSVPRSEEHTSELQSRLHLVCRLLLEKKKSPSVLTVIGRLRCAVLAFWLGL